MAKRRAMKRSIDQKQDKRIRKLEKIVKHVEVKNMSTHCLYNDVTPGTTNVISINTAAVPEPMLFIPEGDDMFSRSGQQIALKNVIYKALIQNTDAASQVYRLTIFDWKSDAVPTLNDIYAVAAPAATVPNATLYPLNPVSLQSGYIKVYHDEVFWLGGSTNDDSSRTRKFEKRFKPISKMNFNDSAGTDYSKGLYLVWSGSVATGTCADVIQCQFTDM